MATQVVSVKHAEVPWSSGLCSCFDNFGSCAYAFCCPMCATASARSNFDGSNWCFNCACVNVCVVRNIVREAYNIEGTCLGDCCTPYWCGPCAIAQILRESDHRGSASAVVVQDQHGQAMVVEQTEGANSWTSGLCGCFDDFGSCAYAFCCPCCANASAVSNYDGSNWCFNCCAKNQCVAQSIIREGKYNIDGSCVGDCCFPAFCGPCVIARLLREVKARGNINQSHHVVQVAPMHPAGMLQAPGMPQAPAVVWLDTDWKELPESVQQAARVLGYDKKSWDKDKKIDIDDKNWVELTHEEQQAAKVIGYTPTAWDED